MQLDTQYALSLLELDPQGLVFFDTESHGTEGDYGSLICGSFKPYRKATYHFAVPRSGDDAKLAVQLRDELERYHCWVTYYGRGHDINLLNTRLLVAGERPVEKRLHLDLYWKIKSHVKTARKSQAHILRLLGTREQKMSVNPDDWNKVMHDRDVLDTILRRCDSDVIGLEALYKRIRHIVVDITK